MKRVIFHIDMDSFFASVEQQARPCLRNRPMAVCGKEKSRSIVVASSVQAKEKGVKTGMPAFKVIKLCPNIEFVEPDPVKYKDVSQRVMDIFSRFSPKMEIFSIDEVFLDMSGLVKNIEQIKCSSQKIKKQLKQEIGSFITCSVGVGGNKFLAKLASDKDKPNGLFIINKQNMDSVLLSSKLTDFCGIGFRLKKRLNDLGVDSVKKLRNFPKNRLIEFFGPDRAQKLHNMAIGRDFSELVCHRSKPKSISRAYTLNQSTADKEKISLVLMHLTEKAGQELRKNNLSAGKIQVFLRYSDFSMVSLGKKMNGYCRDSQKFFQTATTILHKVRFAKMVRAVGIRFDDFVPFNRQLPLWPSERKKLKLVPWLDKINDQCGELTIKPAYLLKMKKLKDRAGGFCK
ncbi:MAG TPA: DNA polymerase IV [Patescibacteria group bacterium]|nr:DNA polymerase IV [Patescibacteria group bacterium]